MCRTSHCSAIRCRYSASTACSCRLGCRASLELCDLLARAAVCAQEERAHRSRGAGATQDRHAGSGTDSARRVCAARRSSPCSCRQPWLRCFCALASQSVGLQKCPCMSTAADHVPLLFVFFPCLANETKGSRVSSGVFAMPAQQFLEVFPADAINFECKSCARGTRARRVPCAVCRVPRAALAG